MTRPLQKPKSSGASSCGRSFYLMGIAAALSVAGSNTSAQTEDLANASYNAWLNEYLVTSNGQTMFCNSTVKRNFQTGWGGAISLETPMDVYERSPSAANYNFVNQVTTTFLAQNGSDWSSDPWNDDLAWMVRMCIRGYMITGNTNLLTAAKNNWNTIYNRGYDTTYGGGIWELMTTAQDNDPTTGSKSALATIPTVIAGCYLYQATGDSTYLTKSQSLFAWVEQNLFNSSTGQVNEGIHSAGLEVSDNFYNTGTFIDAANLLYNITGNRTHYNDALLAADHVSNHISGTGQPILTHGGNGTWANEPIVGMSHFCRDNNLWDRYYSWMVLNATASWNVREPNLNITWNQWDTQTPSNQELYIMQTLGAPTFQMCMPRHFEVETLTVPNYNGSVPRVFTEAGLSSGGGVILDATAVGNYITFLLPSVGARKYDVRVGVKKWGNRGIVQMAIGQAGSTPTNVGAQQDLYSSGASVTELRLGSWTPGTTGDKWVRFTVTGKNASGTGYAAAFDYIRLNPIK